MLDMADYDLGDLLNHPFQAFIKLFVKIGFGDVRVFGGLLHYIQINTLPLSPQ
jgi:hypothetical protein